MGLPFKDIVPHQDIDIEYLRGKTLAIDAFNILYQFLSSIRQPDGTLLMDSRGRTTSHLKGLLNRCNVLLSHNIKLIFCFDGKPESNKDSTLAARNQTRDSAEEAWKQALAEGDMNKAYASAQGATRLRGAEIQSAKYLLTLLGIPFIEAPGEGEAQAAALVRRGDAYAVVSQDYDAILFGAPIIIRNLTMSGKRKMPKTQQYVDVPIQLLTQSEILSSLKLTLHQLIDVALLCGTDFNDGYKGIGPKTALKLIYQNITFQGAANSRNLPIPANLSDLQNIFRLPRVTNDYLLDFRPINIEGLNAFLTDYEFANVKSLLSHYGEIKRPKEEVKQVGQQSGLSQYFDF